MRRYDWAKVYCDILRHPLFANRPDHDKVLVVGLILHAKEYFPEDGVIRGMDAGEMRTAFRIKAAVQRVEEGFQYLLQVGWVRWADDHGNFTIKDFVPRQANAKDSPEAVAERQRRWRERQKQRGTVTGEITGAVTGKVTEEVTGQKTRSASVTRNAEVEVEEEEENDHRSKDGESEGKDTTACESVDNPQPGYANLSESERLHFLKLFREGKGSEATAYLAEKQRPQVPEKIEKKRGAQ